MRYKEFLQFITDSDEPLRPLDQMFTGPILGTFPIRNQNLADLLGIRYLLQPAELPLDATVQTPKPEASWACVYSDAHPTSFNFIPASDPGHDCGLQPLPSYLVYENRSAAPRAFIVPEAAPLPERSDVLSALKTTDFSRRVLLEDLDEPADPVRHDAEGWSPFSGCHGFGAADRVADYAHIPRSPNFGIFAESGGGGNGGADGYLVLTDIWFPGWECLVDHRPARIHRANYLFRAVELGTGAQVVEFVVQRPSYQRGKLISLTALVALVTLTLVATAIRVAGRSAIVMSREECHVARMLNQDYRSGNSPPGLVWPSLWRRCSILVASSVGWNPHADLQDFVEYWGAGRLNSQGQNPYDPALLYQMERMVSPGLTEAIMMWNPPWTLALAMPFSWLPAQTSHALWIAIQLTALLASVDWLWRSYGGPSRYRWLAWLLSVGFLPTFFALRMGQISPLILLALVGFLHFERRGQGRWLAPRWH